jgi:hypothetical protein
MYANIIIVKTGRIISCTAPVLCIEPNTESNASHITNIVIKVNTAGVIRNWNEKDLISKDGRKRNSINVVYVTPFTVIGCTCENKAITKAKTMDIIMRL